MAKPKRKQTPTQKAYHAQVRRIKQFIRRAGKRGFIFPEDLLPKVPKRITAGSVRRLKRITPEKLYQKATYVSGLSYGEEISGIEGLKLERKERARKAQETKARKKREKEEATQLSPVQPEEDENEDTTFFDRAAIFNFKNEVMGFDFLQQHKILLYWIDQQIYEHGEHEVALMLYRGSQAGLLVDFDIVYYDEPRRDFMFEMLKYLDVPQWVRDEVMEKYDEDIVWLESE